MERYATHLGLWQAVRYSRKMRLPLPFLSLHSWYFAGLPVCDACLPARGKAEGRLQSILILNLRGLFVENLLMKNLGSPWKEG